MMIMDEQIEHLNQCYANPDLKAKKIDAIKSYKSSALRDISDFKNLENNAVLKQHRSWSFFSQTRSEEMIEKLRPLANQYSNTTSDDIERDQTVAMTNIVPKTTPDVQKLLELEKQKRNNTQNRNNTKTHYSPGNAKCETPKGNAKCETPNCNGNDCNKPQTVPGAFAGFKRMSATQHADIMAKPAGYDQLIRPNALT